MPLHSVSVIIVNNSIFENSGQSHDYFTKCSFVLNELRGVEYHVSHVSILREDVDTIATDIAHLYKLYDFVIVVGKLKSGIIFSGVNKAKNASQRNGEKRLPENGKYLYGHDRNHSVLHSQRIFFLEESLVESLLPNVLLKHLEHYRQQPTYTKTLTLLEDSYKNFNPNDIVVKVQNKITVRDGIVTLILKSNQFEEIVEAEKYIRTQNVKVVKSVEDNLMGNLIYSSKDGHIQHALQAVEKCFEDYGPENVFLSFNGGKDCTVLLHLTMTVLRRKYPNYSSKFLCLYVKSKSAFKLQEEFIEQCAVFYNLEILIEDVDIKESLARLLKNRPNLKASLMGRRRTDSHTSDLSVFQMTDAGWPQIMRVCPLLDWLYSDIWDYLLYYKVPYCKLYDIGYTSIGDVGDTSPNNLLINSTSVVNGNDSVPEKKYLPAYRLLTEKSERNARYL